MLISMSAYSQISTSDALENLNYSNPRTFQVGGITISGTQSLDHSALRAIAGLEVGEEIQVPGEDISKAIKNLWRQELFTDVSVQAVRVVGDQIFLNIDVTERPRLSKFRFKGIKKSKQESIRSEINLIRGKVVTKNLIKNTENIIRNYFIEKGYYNVDVHISQELDSMLTNSVILTIAIDRNKRVKVAEINIEGNEKISDKKIEKAMKNTKEKGLFRIFKPSKLIKENYEADLKSAIALYNSKGYRDAKILNDSIYEISKGLVGIEITVFEGKKYYFGNIEWVGNSKYSNKELSRILGIEEGEIYNQELLESRIYQDPTGRDISSLYLNDGYLFFSPTIVETGVRGDSIDFEIRLREGKQAIIDEVTVVGNTKTNDHVIMREIRTRPGELFNRSDIIRTQRELAQLGYFNPQKFGVNPVPNQEDGTVDIEYVVEEKPSDQVELSGGWGGGRIVGSLGLTFNNFSARNIFNGEAWDPLPAGDGQRLSLRAQTNGVYYQSYNFSFTEPWLGGRKPNSLSFSAYYSAQSNGAPKTITVDGRKIENPTRQALGIWGISLGLGRRLSWPDDYFTLYNEIAYQYYTLNNYFSSFAFANGIAHNLSFKTVFSRNSIDAPIYPTRGSQTSISLQFTLPYSLFDEIDDYSEQSQQERYKFVEYHKWKFNSSWFTPITEKLVVNTKIGYGFLGFYDRSKGQSPFERFYLGGDGLSGFALDGREIIALRGYDDGVLSPSTGASIAAKYTVELRYPVSLNPSATIYGLAFVEAGNSWSQFNDFRPFQVRRAAGFGVRIFMPFFGLLGLDWGYRFDDIPGRTDPSKRSEIHFTIGGNINGW